jgi:hypothetical protein
MILLRIIGGDRELFEAFYFTFGPECKRLKFVLARITVTQLIQHKLAQHIKYQQRHNHNKRAAHPDAAVA